MNNEHNPLLSIHFSRSWWNPIFQQKAILCVIFLTEIGCNIFSTTIPFLMGTTFSLGRPDYLILLFCAWSGAYCIQYITRSTYAKIQYRIVHSLHAAAHLWFLQIDPIYHTKRASGAIAGKIDRGARAYEHLMDSCFYELLPIGVGFATVITIFSRYNGILGSMIALLLVFLIVSIVFFAHTIIQPLELEFIKNDDKTRGVSIENLAQINLIRASFASNEVSSRLKKLDAVMIEKENALLMAIFKVYLGIRLAYIAILLIIALFILHQIMIKEMTEAAGIGLLGMYIQGTRDILKFDRPIKQITKSVTNISDLFKYIESFGKQTFPVLQEESCSLDNIIVQEKKGDVITIRAENLSFDYQAHTKLFDNHSLVLTIKKSEKIKLYGIIGPSGIGKSTLLSILGGQLHPSKGEVIISEVALYAVDDNIRRKIISLQGQTATNFRGTLEYNLLFGLPEKVHAYTNDHLIAILKKVGIWEFFEKKEGLNTFIGEGGLSLSGGQRQRLNFANLYLRACYFKPSVILIDEPTSSLDELSEQAITDMIIELSHDAVTMVIAHRLKTLSQAIGILDCSLLSQSKKIEFYTHSELLKRSEYYKNLMHGAISFED